MNLPQLSFYAKLINNNPYSMKPFPNRIYQVFLLFFAPILVLAALYICLPQYFSSLIDSPQYLSYTWFLGILGLGVLVNVLKGSKLSFNFNISNTRLLFSLSIVVFLFKLAIGIPSYYFLNQLLHDGSISMSKAHEMPSLLIHALLFVPILEELVFRGTIQQGLQTRYSVKSAVLFTGLFFGLLHMPPQYVSSIVLGLFYSYIYVKTKSLGICIFLHFIGNLSTLLINYFFFELGNYGFIFSLISLPILVYMIVRNYKLYFRGA